MVLIDYLLFDLWPMNSPVNRFVSPRDWTFFHTPPGPTGSSSPSPTCWCALRGLGTEAFPPSFRKSGSPDPTSRRSPHNACGRSPRGLKSQLCNDALLESVERDITSVLHTYPCIPACPPCHAPASHPSVWQPGPGQRCECVLPRLKKVQKHTLNQLGSLTVISHSKSQLLCNKNLKTNYDWWHGFAPATACKWFCHSFSGVRWGGGTGKIK